MEAKKKRNSLKMTYMVITVNALFALGNIPNSFQFVFQQYLNPDSIFFNVFSVLASYALIIFSQGADIWIYYIFNTHFKIEFKKLFKFQ
jgi:hypothetical protein